MHSPPPFFQVPLPVDTPNKYDHLHPTHAPPPKKIIKPETGSSYPKQLRWADLTWPPFLYLR